DRQRQIAQIIADAEQIEQARPVAFAMSAPADRVNLEAARGEINHRVMPAPGTVPCAVDQQQRYSVASVVGAEDLVLELWHRLAVKIVKCKVAGRRLQVTGYRGSGVEKLSPVTYPLSPCHLVIVSSCHRLTPRPR